jgi:hypothetical protein
VLAASFKTPRQALDCLLAGCESITLPLDVAQQFITSPAVDAAIVKFEQDWQGRLGGRLSDGCCLMPSLPTLSHREREQTLKRQPEGCRLL